MISPIAGVSRVVDDDQVVVGVERQMIRIERAFGLPRRERERFGERTGHVPERRHREPGCGDREPRVRTRVGRE